MCGIERLVFYCCILSVVLFILLTVQSIMSADQSREVGYCSNVPAVPLKFCHGGHIKAMSTSEPPANQGILTVVSTILLLWGRDVGGCCSPTLSKEVMLSSFLK